MKKIFCILLVVCLLCSVAFADGVPRLSDNLFKCAKQAIGYLASAEYERLVTLLPFSDVSPSASEWENFAGNFSNLSNTQKDYAVAYWTGSCWNVAVPVQVPESGSTEVLVLTSDDGEAFAGYRYASWSQIESEYTSSNHVTWNREYVSSAPVVVVD